jgi:hypothetical protein
MPQQSRRGKSLAAFDFGGIWFSAERAADLTGKPAANMRVSR